MKFKFVSGRSSLDFSRYAERIMIYLKEALRTWSWGVMEVTQEGFVESGQ